MLKFAIKKTSKDIFHDAVASKDTSRLKFILQNNRLGFEVDELDDDGLTALQRSCFIGNLKLVQLLVTYGANIHIQDREGWSVLHASAVAGNYSILRYLISTGADVSVRNDLGQLPIDLANDLNSIIVLLEAMIKAGHSDLIEQYFTQRPSLKGLIEDKLRLLSPENQDASHGNINISSEGENRNQKSQLSLVLDSDNTQEDSVNTTHAHDSLETLLSSSNNKIGVRLNKEGGKPDEVRILEDKRTPKRAVCKKCLGKKRSSSASSASSDSSSSSYDSAYISSVSLHSDSHSNGHLDLENLADELSISCNLSKQTSNSTKHKIHNCKKKDKKHMTRSLSSPARLTPAKQAEMLAKIKELNDDVNSLNSAGLSLLHVCANRGDSEGAQMLLEKGAEVNRQALSGSSPLHEAARSGDLHCTLLLLSYGADMFADDDNGLLPIDLADNKQLKLLLHRAMAMK